MNRFHRNVTRVLQDLGAVDIVIVKQGAHPRVCFSFNGAFVEQTISNSPSDLNAINHFEQTMRRLLHIPRAKRVAAKPRRRKTKTKPPAQCPALSSLPDWRDQLRSGIGSAAP